MYIFASRCRLNKLVKSAYVCYSPEYLLESCRLGNAVGTFVTFLSSFLFILMEIKFNEEGGQILWHGEVEDLTMDSCWFGVLSSWLLQFIIWFTWRQIRINYRTVVGFISPTCFNVLEVTFKGWLEKISETWALEGSSHHLWDGFIKRKTLKTSGSEITWVV